METFYEFLRSYIELNKTFELQEIPLREKIVNIILQLQLTQAQIELDESVKLIIITAECKYNQEDMQLLYYPKTMQLTTEQKLKVRKMKYTLKKWYSKIQSIIKEKNDNNKSLIIDEADEVDEDSFDGANFYNILGINKHANIVEIKDAYHKLCLIHHPDKGGDIKKVILFKCE